MAVVQQALLLLLIFVNVKSILDEEYENVVETTYGSVRGFKLEANTTSKLLTKFLGIPYARPPIGQLRFKHPLPPEPWENTINATAFPKSCFQNSIPFIRHIPLFKKIAYVGEMSEDCLYLNVFVPEPKPKLAPVAVFIHGGAFNVGSSSIELYDGTAITTEEKIVFVTFNYRLSSLGFAYLNDTDMDPNPGLYDQLLALKWVHDNIEFFGGDPDKVTLVGQSAGSASVGHHLLSDMSKGYFKRAILQSGTAISNWAYQSHKRNKDFVMSLAGFLECPDLKNMNSVVQCLRESDINELILNNPSDGIDMNVFQPIIDGIIIKDEPLKRLKEKQFKKTELMIGVTRDEGGFFLALMKPDAFPLINKLRLYYEDFEEVVTFLLRYLPQPVIKTAMYQYTNYNNKDDTSEILHASQSLFGDSQFICDANAWASAYAEIGLDVYYYLFAQKSSLNTVPEWMGIIHGQDLAYSLGLPLQGDLNFTKQDTIFSRKVMRTFANFVRTGNPNQSPRGKRSPVNFPKYTPDKQLTLLLKHNTSAVIRKFRKQKCVFWNELVPFLKTAFTAERNGLNR